MKLMKLSFLLLMLVSLTFSCSKEGDDPMDDEMIVEIITPGEGITQISLGNSGQKVFDVYGETQDSWGAIGGVYQHFLYYPSLGLIFYLEDNNSETLDLTKGVRKIVITAPYAGKTAEDIKIGSTRTDVISAYGEPDDTFFGDDYESLGITFVYDDDNLVVESIEIE